MPAARAARSMCSVVSRSALPCSLSMITASKPAKAHISTSAGLGRPLKMARTACPLRIISGSRVSMGWRVGFMVVSWCVQRCARSTKRFGAT